MAAKQWKPIRLGAVCSKIGSGATPHGGSGVYFEAGPFALIRSQNIYNEGFHHDGLAFIEDVHAAELNNVEVLPGDILLNITGDSVARCCQVDNSILPARVNQHVAIIRTDKTRLDARFLRYALISPDMQAQLLSWAGAGGTRNALTKGMIESLEVIAPDDIKEQQAIAYVLGTLDDKIELNRRINQTLEGMARSVFKSWFVNFDPIHAKAEGRNTGLPTYIEDLFPAAFEESELGEIPKGWRLVSLADTVEIFGGGTPKTAVAEYWNGTIPWFSVVDAPPESDVWVIDTEKKITQAGVENSSTRVLPVGTTIISARGTVGRIALVGVPMAMNQSCYGLVGKDNSHGFFTYFATRTLISRLQQHAHGSVFDTITRDTLQRIVLVVPPADLVKAFDQYVFPSLERIRTSLLASRTLSTLRDTLLPRLISGELRVTDIEHIIGAQG